MNINNIESCYFSFQILSLEYELLNSQYLSLIITRLCILKTCIVFNTSAVVSLRKVLLNGTEVGLGLLQLLPVLEPYKGAFNNHVDIIFLFFDHPPTSVDIFYALNVDKNGNFWTTYPPPLVHVMAHVRLTSLKIYY